MNPTFYDTQAAAYEVTRRLFLWGRKRAIEELNLQPGETVLEIGCGTGWNLPLLTRKVGSSGHVIGIEISRKMASKAVGKRIAPNVLVILADASRNLPFNKNVDAALFSYSFSAIPARDSVLNHVLSVLKDSGRIALVDFCQNRHAPRIVNKLFCQHGKRNSCDFKADPEPWLCQRGFRVKRSSQFFGFSYRLVAHQADV